MQTESVGTDLTTTQAGERLGVHRRTVERWIKAGQMAGRLVGDRWLTTVAEVERFAVERVESDLTPAHGIPRPAVAEAE